MSSPGTESTAARLSRLGSSGHIKVGWEPPQPHVDGCVAVTSGVGTDCTCGEDGWKADRWWRDQGGE
ncbi:MAG TPA: hypothetical protein VGJ13_04940 [Pseudonocardiaceae bacterium]|jgi:hypothetical protein